MNLLALLVTTLLALPSIPTEESQTSLAPNLKGNEWRIYVDVVEEAIHERQPALSYRDVRAMARGFVAASRDLDLPLWMGPAIADIESEFKWWAVGKAGERSIMQILPVAGRPMEKIGSDSRYAIFYGLGIVKADGLRAYNRSRPWAHRVAAARLHRYNGGLWDEVVK